MANPRSFLDAAGDGPLTFGQRLAGDPRIARVIEGNLPALSQIDPQLTARLQQRDPEAIFEAYQMIVGSGGRLKAPEQAFSAVDEPARQMDLGLAGDNEPPSRAMIPFGTRGPGVAMGGPTGPGTARDVRGDMILSRLRGIGTNAAPLYNPGREMIPSPMRGLPFTPSQPARIMGPQEQIAAQFDRALSPQLERGRYVETMRGESLGVPGDDIPAYRQGDMPPAPPKRSKLRDIAAAGAAAAGGAALVDVLSPLDSDSAAILNTGGEAELAAETRPTPVVEATDETPEPTVLQAPPQPVDYSLEARKLIDQLNKMRRAAGGEVPEAAEMQREIQRLLALGNQTRKATYAAAPQDDPSRMYQQAQGLIDQVNQMYRQGMTPNSPEVRQIMTKVRQLQSQGDAMRNRRSA